MAQNGPVLGSAASARQQVALRVAFQTRGAQRTLFDHRLAALIQRHPRHRVAVTFEF
jgi:hypothetical protein